VSDGLPRRVGLNLLYLDPGNTGGAEMYARRLVPELARAAPETEFVALLGARAYEAGDLLGFGEQVRTVRVPIAGSGRASRVIAEQLLLPRMVRRERIDLLHSLGTTAPRFPRVTSVVTVLDVIYALHPEAHSRAMRTGMRVLVPLAVKGADRLLALSNAAAAEISSELGVASERIDVVQLAGAPRGPAAGETELRERLGLGDAPLLLSVSARRGHKNIGRLLDAFAALDLQPEPMLVLPGYPTATAGELEQRARRLGIADRVKMPGWVSDADLEGLYGAAVCSVFPSLTEGFGLPVLEAMERELPVACSDIPVLHEVGGDAALYFDPHSTDQIAQALRRLIEDRELARRLAAAGVERAQQFSWRATAEGTLACYARAWAAAQDKRSTRA
jgi:glycosyltransferase involved in cell wall biosynthesis